MSYAKMTILVLLLIVLAIFLGIYSGLNAEMRYEDMEVNLATITSSGRLGVLSAHVNILNSLMMGSSSNPDYLKLYGQEATAVYTVDLSQAEISRGVNEKGEEIIFVRLPEPVVQLYVDESSVENIAEYQANANWTGTAEEGYMAYNAQKASSYKEMLDSLQESDGLMLEAKQSAMDRVSELISAVSLDEVRCEVFFSESGRR